MSGFDLNADHDISYPVMTVAKTTKTNNEPKLEQAHNWTAAAAAAAADGRTDGRNERECMKI